MAGRHRNDLERLARKILELKYVDMRDFAGFIVESIKDRTESYEPAGLFESEALAITLLEWAQSKESVYQGQQPDTPET